MTENGKRITSHTTTAYNRVVLSAQSGGCMPTRRLVLACSLLAASLLAQAPAATEFDKLHFRLIGPAIMSGRIADLAVYEPNPAIYYVGAAHGGVWKTTSNG